MEWSRNILLRSTFVFGNESQVDKSIEEMSELIKALLKHRHDRIWQDSKGQAEYRKSIIEEISDVQIMIDQLKIIFDCENECSIIRKKKLQRLNDYLDRQLEQ